MQAPDSSKNHNAALEKYEEKTCTWIISGTHFNGWKEKADILLWICGMREFSMNWITTVAEKAEQLGAAKQSYGELRHVSEWTQMTISLSSFVIKHIANHCKANTSIACAYFFFDRRDSQKSLQLHGNLIRSLILQLWDQCDGTPAALVELYGKGHQQPSIGALEETLRQVIDEFDEVFIMIDALDECTERASVLKWIETSTIWNVGKLHLLVTSRPEKEIGDRLKLLQPAQISVEREAKNRDIEIHLDRILSTDNAFTLWDDENRGLIKTTLLERADGMYAFIRNPLIESTYDNL